MHGKVRIRKMQEVSSSVGIEDLHHWVREPATAQVIKRGATFQLMLFGYAGFIIVYSIMACNPTKLCDAWWGERLFSFMQASMTHFLWAMQLVWMGNGQRVLPFLILVVGATAVAAFFPPYTYDLLCSRPPPSGTEHVLRCVRSAGDIIVATGLWTYLYRFWPERDSADMPVACRTSSIFFMVSILQSLKFMLRFVNTLGSSQHQNEVSGGVAMLIILEIFLEYGQGFLLLITSPFEGMFLEWLKNYWQSESHRPRTTSTLEHSFVQFRFQEIAAHTFASYVRVSGTVYGSDEHINSQIELRSRSGVTTSILGVSPFERYHSQLTSSDSMGPDGTEVSNDIQR